MIDTEDRPKAEPHPGEPCENWWESATPLDRRGVFTVTEHCRCGAIVGSYQDRVL